MSYRTSISSGYGYECPTEFTEILCRVIPGVNTPGTVLRTLQNITLKHFDQREVLYPYRSARLETVAGGDNRGSGRLRTKNWVPYLADDLKRVHTAIGATESTRLFARS